MSKASFLDDFNDERILNLNVQLCLGVGYKGEIVNVPRDVAYTELLPAQLALYPTPENIALFEEERKSLVDRPQISPFVAKCRDYLKTILLPIPINVKLKQWELTPDNIRIALRRTVKLSENQIFLLDYFSLLSLERYV